MYIPFSCVTVTSNNCLCYPCKLYITKPVYKKNNYRERMSSWPLLSLSLLCILALKIHIYLHFIVRKKVRFWKTALQKKPCSSKQESCWHSAFDQSCYQSREGWLTYMGIHHVKFTLPPLLNKSSIGQGTVHKPFSSEIHSSGGWCLCKLRMLLRALLWWRSCNTFPCPYFTFGEYDSYTRKLSEHKQTVRQSL